MVVSAGAAAAAGIAAWGAVAPSSQLYGPTVRHTPSAKKIALTFDDGPNPAVTPQLLDLLDRYSAPATFFLIGKFVRECPGLVREMSARGHVLGQSHGHSRKSIPSIPRGNSRPTSAMRGRDFRRHAGKPPRWMRPPYGYRSPLLGGEVRKRGNPGRGDVVENLLGLDAAAARAIDRAARERRAPRPPARRHRRSARWRSSRPGRRPPARRRGPRTLASPMA